MDLPEIGSLWVHNKNRTVYVVVGYCMLEREWKKAVLYLRVNETTRQLPIAREASEFMDGRFTRLDRIDVATI